MVLDENKFKKDFQTMKVTVACVYVLALALAACLAGMLHYVTEMSKDLADAETEIRALKKQTGTGNPMRSGLLLTPHR